MSFPLHTPPGLSYRGAGRAEVSVWAPRASSIELLLEGRGAPLALARDSEGYWRAELSDIAPGQRYRFRIDGARERPDPASRHQPDGVHGPSAVVDQQFVWSDQGWRGLPLRDYVIYELHVGAFSPEGSFAAIIPQLPRLRELGVTAIELMPVAHFPGRRNWGYDGVYLYAPHSAYGGVAGLKQLVDACHAQGLAVVLDVVYNHFGPEGNYLWDYAREFFTDRYHTPWGDAINYDGPEAAPVRHFIIANALYWLREFHIDALRLDAVHEIYDRSAYHILAEMNDQAQAQAVALGRAAHLIAEGHDPRLVRPRAGGGLGLAAHWADEFHHAAHVLLTGEARGYMAGFGQAEHLARAYRQVYVFDHAGPPAASRRAAAPATGDPARFVVCLQNHDQVGNRALGDRLGDSLSFAELKLGAAATLLAPFVPLIFMGEEYAEPAPFQYFTDHSDPDLVRGVREGRRREFAAFVAEGQALPDPQAEATLGRSTLDPSRAAGGRHRVMQALYQELLRLRRAHPSLTPPDLAAVAAEADDGARLVRVAREAGDERSLLLLNFAGAPHAAELPPGRWRVALDTAAAAWAEGGPGAATGSGPVLESRLELAAHSAVLLIAA